MLDSACEYCTLGVYKEAFFMKYLTHLSELHLIHALASVPVEECLATEHGSKLLRDSLEQFLRTFNIHVS